MEAESEEEPASTLRPGRSAGGQWLPGVSGNPLGRQHPGQRLSEALAAAVDAHELARVLVQLALSKRDLSAIQYIYDRLEGRPHQSQDVDLRGSLTVVEAGPDLGMTP